MLEFLFVVFLITLAWYFLKDGKKEQSKTPNESSEPPNLKTGDDYLAQKIKVFIFDNWQLKVGSILVFIGLVLLARYAIMHNLIGPMERILLGIVLSCFVSILGQLRLKSNFNQGIVLLTLGAIGGITTTVLGQHLYSLYANWFSALLSLCFLIHLLLMSN
ncbi:MAG: DUF2339 domain-containing protein, partial [Deltaproteobacteria bacterium]|nr:DUF2339 domain-containing protein [Deltaproteobacteria bacterium]